MTTLPMSDAGGEVRAGEKSPGQPPTGAVIREFVLTSLGRPPGLFRVAVLPLWGSYYRVNVLTGPDATSVCIPHSYFVEAGDDGAVVSASPPIIRLYP